MRRAKAWHVTAAAVDPLYRVYLSRSLLAHRAPPPHGSPESPGHVVEFLKAGKPVCGVLMRKGSRADWILDAHGKEDHVDHEKIVDVSPAFVGAAQARHSIVEQLRAIDQERGRLKDSINPYELGIRRPNWPLLWHISPISARKKRSSTCWLRPAFGPGTRTSSCCGARCPRPSRNRQSLKRRRRIGCQQVRARAASGCAGSTRSPAARAVTSVRSVSGRALPVSRWACISRRPRCCCGGRAWSSKRLPSGRQRSVFPTGSFRCCPRRSPARPRSPRAHSSLASLLICASTVLSGCRAGVSESAACG